MEVLARRMLLSFVWKHLILSHKQDWYLRLVKFPNYLSTSVNGILFAAVIFLENACCRRNKPGWTPLKCSLFYFIFSFLYNFLFGLYGLIGVYFQGIYYCCYFLLSFSLLFWILLVNGCWLNGPQFAIGGQWRGESFRLERVFL